MRYDIKTVEDAIDLFLEYRDKHGYDEETAKSKTIIEFIDANISEEESEDAEDD